VSAGDTLARSEISSVLQLLSTLQADGFAEHMSPQDLGEAPYTIGVELADGSRRTVQLHPAPAGRNYIATASGYPYVVELRKRSWDRSVLRGRSALLKNE